jgi:hypothetical protein
MKVVINKCFGGFSISVDAARFMAARGNAKAASEIAEYDEKVADPTKQDEIERKYGPRWYGFGYGHPNEKDNSGYGRTDPDLVAAVEELGKRASGEMSNLKVVEIPDGVEFEISEYDGNEHIAEAHRTWA